MKSTLLPALINPMSYESYHAKIIEYAKEGGSSGEQTPEHIAATKINAQRISRIDKQCELQQQLKADISLINNKQNWVIIAETWCGDSAQCIPVIAKMAAYAANISLQIVFRDENMKFMIEFLTDGKSAIPKLICLNEVGEVIGHWGPRPKAIQEKVGIFKKEFSKATHSEFVNNLHLWYARDKTISIQNELAELIPCWI